MKELPKKIWLQVEEDGEPFDEGQVTWCQDRINTSDVEYIKLSELPTEEEIQSMTYSILFPYVHPPSESWDRDVKRLSRAILNRLKGER